MKTTFKVIWISLLSTIVTVLAHLLADTTHHPLFILKTPLLDIPYLFLMVTLLIFTLLTLIFIGIKSYLPASKLTKGILYTSLISIVWIVLNLEPTTIKSFAGFIITILVVLAPMSVYGVFLGYLSSEQTNKLSISLSYLSIFIIMILWLSFRGLYYLIDVDAPKRSNILETILWLSVSSIVIGVVFSIFKKLIKLPFLTKAVWLFNLVSAIFVSYYLMGYSLGVVFYPMEYVKILFDIVSVMLALIISMLLFERRQIEIDY